MLLLRLKVSIGLSAVAFYLDQSPHITNSMHCIYSFILYSTGFVAQGAQLFGGAGGGGMDFMNLAALVGGGANGIGGGGAASFAPSVAPTSGNGMAMATVTPRDSGDASSMVSSMQSSMH